MNPNGSIKDRPAWNMVKTAEENGKLKYGQTIIEASGGNVATSLASIGAARGYKIMTVMGKSTASEKVDLSALLGAENILVPGVPFGNENNFYHTARKIA